MVPFSSTDYLHVICLASFPSLHGLSTQQVSRKQCVDGGGAPDPPGVLPSRGSPETGILGDPSPQQLAAPLPSAAVPVPRPSQTRLIGAWMGLPAGGGGQRLTLCKEAVHFLLPGELCQDGSVTQNAPGQGRKRTIIYPTRI